MLANAHESVLCLIDIQPRLLAAMDQAEQAAVVTNSSKLLQAAKVLQIPRLFSEQYPQGLGQCHSALLSQAGNSPVISKTVFSCLSCEDWQHELDKLGRRQLIMTGIEAHICVAQTALEALEAGYDVHIVADAIAARGSDNKQLALTRLAHAGATINNVESVLFEWMRSAQHPDFKTISKLIQ